MFVDGKVVMIVAAGRGLGATLAVGVPRTAPTSCSLARTVATLEQIAADCPLPGAQVLALPTDVSDREQVHALADAAHAEFGRIDVLVNCVPPAPGGPVVDMDDDALDALAPQPRRRRLRHLAHLSIRRAVHGRGRRWRDRQRHVDDQPHGPRRPQRLRAWEGRHAPPRLGAGRRARTASASA